MIITGIEIIPGDNEQVAVAPGQRLQVTSGQKIRLTATIDHKGSGVSATFYAALGSRGVGFNEWRVAQVPVTFTEDADWKTYPLVADIDTLGVDNNTNCDLYCKLNEYPKAGMPQVDNVIDIVGAPTFELLEETIYPYAYVYDGKCEVSEFTFRTDAFTPSNWVAGKLAAEVEKQVKQAGGRVMELKVYVDRSPLLWSDWKLEVTSTPAPSATAGQGMGSLGLWWLGIAIIAALAILLIIVITWAAKTIISSFTHQALSEEIKKTWSRESLISVIGDFETKLERTPTPPADLEKKSDQGLRDYCDSLAKEIVPPAGLGLGVAIAAAAVLGLGALVLVGMATAKAAK